MDNITRKSSISILSKVFNYIFIVMPILADFLGVTSLFIPKLQEWISGNIGTFPCVLIVVIFNVILVGNVVFILDRHSQKNVDRTKKLVEGYNKFLEKYSKSLLEFEKKCDELNTENALNDELSERMKDFVDEIRNVLGSLTNAKLRVCVKSFPEKYTHHDVTKMELITLCRSDKSTRESSEERKERILVNENTDFKLIMINAYPYFAFNDLLSFEKQTLMEYENSTVKWEKKYNATIVYPISNYLGEVKGKAQYEVLGFLCADTLSTKTFSAEVGPLCIKFMSSLSYLMYIFLDKCIECRERIERMHNEKAKECVGVE